MNVPVLFVCRTHRQAKQRSQLQERRSLVLSPWQGKTGTKAPFSPLGIQTTRLGAVLHRASSKYLHVKLWRKPSATAWSREKPQILTSATKPACAFSPEAVCSSRNLSRVTGGVSLCHMTQRCVFTLISAIWAPAGNAIPGLSQKA